MERKYYAINESNAKVSHELMSFSDYKAGSTTESYRQAVDEMYDLADKTIEARPEEEERIKHLAYRYASRMAEYYNRKSTIGMMCPSVMISGPANFPAAKKKRQNDAWDRNHEFYENTQKIFEKVQAIYRGKDIIKSNDEFVIEKLEQKLADLKELHEKMKAANKAVRMKNTDDGDSILLGMGYDMAEIKALREGYLGHAGYPQFAMQNSHANIRNCEKRLEEIRKAKFEGNKKTEYDGFKLIKNVDIMRYQLVFDGIPSDETRSIMKSHGFVFSRKNKAWQRQLTKNSEYAVNKVVKLILELDSIY